MPEDYAERLEQLDKPWFYRLAWGGGAILFAVAAVLWWQVASVSPERVFWGTVSNNLIITGVSKHTVSQEETGSLDQRQQLSLGAQNVVTTKATIEQAGASGGPTTKVVTETIATPQADFARYTSIETSQNAPNGQAFNFTPVLNQWSKQEIQGGGSGAFGEALFGLVPFGNVQGATRRHIVADMQKNQAYQIDYSQVGKRRENGRLIYDYTVSVDPEQYVKALKQIDAAMGVKSLDSLDPSQYAGGGLIQIKVSIDARAQQMISLAYPDGSRTESYSSYGIFAPSLIPEQTIPQTALQGKLDQILGTQ